MPLSSLHIGRNSLVLLEVGTRCTSSLAVWKRQRDINLSQPRKVQEPTENVQIANRGPVHFWQTAVDVSISRTPAALFNQKIDVWEVILSLNTYKRVIEELRTGGKEIDNPVASRKTV
jgi:hypothetical protein